jgi:hypothetical protein
MFRRSAIYVPRSQHPATGLYFELHKTSNYTNHYFNTKFNNIILQSTLISPCLLVLTSDSATINLILVSI